MWLWEILKDITESSAPTQDFSDIPYAQELVPVIHLQSLAPFPNLLRAPKNTSTPPDLAAQIKEVKELLKITFINAQPPHQLLRALACLIKHPDYSSATLLQFTYREKAKIKALAKSKTAMEIVLDWDFTAENKLGTEESIPIFYNLMLHDDEKLHFPCDSLAAKGLQYLVSALKNNTLIREIDLSHNKITTEDMQLFIEMLQKNRTIHTLNFYGCKIDEAGALLLIEFLKTNTTIHSINFYGNDEDKGVVPHLLEAMRSNLTLSNLDFSSYRYQQEGNIVNEVRRIVHRNSAINAIVNFIAQPDRFLNEYAKMSNFHMLAKNFSSSWYTFLGNCHELKFFPIDRTTALALSFLVILIIPPDIIGDEESILTKEEKCTLMSQVVQSLLIEISGKDVLLQSVFSDHTDFQRLGLPIINAAYEKLGLREHAPNLLNSLIPVPIESKYSHY